MSPRPIVSSTFAAALCGTLSLLPSAVAGPGGATLLQVDAGYTSADAAAIANGVIVGAALPEPDPYAPCVWEGRQQTFRVLPYLRTAVGTTVRATDGQQHVGVQSIFNRSQLLFWTEAVLWENGALIFLHQPAAWESSEAYAVCEGRQGGVVVTRDGRIEATLWSGTAASAVSLHPGGPDDFSAVTAMAPGVQVGGMDILNAQSQFFSHAMWWAGTAGSAIDLHPADATASYALATDGAQHAGYVVRDSIREAAVWTGTSPAPISLHPAGALESTARGIAAGTTVGYAIDADGFSRAKAWRVAAGQTPIDLHALLPAGYTYSFANGIDATGSVVGSALEESTGLWRAVLWQVPIDAATLSDFFPPLRAGTGERSFVPGQIIPVKVQAKNTNGNNNRLSPTLSVFELGPAADSNQSVPGTPIAQNIPLAGNGVYNFNLSTKPLRPGYRYRLVVSEASITANRVCTFVLSDRAAVSRTAQPRIFGQ